MDSASPPSEVLTATALLAVNGDTSWYLASDPSLFRIK